jgi:hypothetical protein
MDMEIIEKIAKSLNKEETNKEAHAYFPDKSYKTFKIEKNNFHEIKETKKSSKLCFIDGGNTELLQSANNSLQLIRIYYAIYNGNKRIKSKKFEFLALISSEHENNKIFYKTKLFDNIINIDEKDLIFDPFDNTIKTGIHQTRISKIGSIVRRFSELKIAETILSELEKDDVIILDGFLQSSVTNEDKYFQNLYKKAEEKGIIISGLSKTTTLLTTNGSSVLSTLNKIAPKTSWYYHPVAEISNKDHKAEIFFIKLHEKSKYIFRFELYKNQEYDIDSILNLLTKNSKDPVFLGYPYGLIEADKFARVSNQERAYIQTILKTKIKEWDKINNLDAHDILDNIG